MAKKTKKNKKPLTKKQMKKLKRKRLLIIEIVVLVVLLAVLGIWIWYNNSDKGKTEEMLEGYTCVALFGVDNRGAGNFEDGRSDTIIIACINNDTKEVKLCSVYRDTFLDVEDGDLEKCNAAYGRGGQEQAIEMLNKNLDLDIEDYVAVDFNALVDVVDQVGGIEVDLTKEEVKYLNSYIDETAESAGKSNDKVKSSGTQTLNGVQATAYCRIRYTAGDDFKRTSRQREVLTKVAEKATNLSTAQKIAVASSIIDEIDTSLSAKQITTLVKAMSDYKLADTAGFPFARTTGTFGKKGSVVVPCTLESNVVELHKYLFDEDDYEVSDDVSEISQSIISYTGKDEEDAQDYQSYDY